jgi:hypothetical protein
VRHRIPHQHWQFGPVCAGQRLLDGTGVGGEAHRAEGGGKAAQGLGISPGLVELVGGDGISEFSGLKFEIVGGGQPNLEQGLDIAAQSLEQLFGFERRRPASADFCSAAGDWASPASCSVRARANTPWCT